MTCSLQKKKMRKSLLFEQNHGLSPLENLAVLHFLKLQFSGLKIILFDPELKKKTIFSDLTSPKKHK